MWLQVSTGPDAGSAVELPDNREFVLGRQRGADLIIRDSRASRRHASLTPLSDGRWELKDLDSANGTYVDGRRVMHAELEGGEDLRIGSVEIAVTRSGPGQRPTFKRDLVTNLTPAGDTDLAPQLATHSMVQRLVDASSKRATRTGLLAGSAAAVVAVIAVVVLIATGVIGGGSDDAVPQVVAKLRPSTVLITTKLNGSLNGTGSGWVLDANEGLIVTNGHVINQGNQFTVSARGRTQNATVVGVAPCEDLALLKVSNTNGLQTARLAPPGSVAQGETVVAMGYQADATAGDDAGSTRGVVSSKRTTFHDPSADVPAYPNVLQTDTSLNPGNSGGPLVDLDARVVGVNSAARSTGSDGRTLQNVNYAITIDHARTVLNDLRSGRGRGWTGLTFLYPTSEDLQAARLPDGLRVQGVIPGTPAAGAGIKEGDLIAGVNGRKIANTLQSYCDVAGALTSGTEVVLNIAEPGRAQTRTVRVKLA